MRSTRTLLALGLAVAVAAALVTLAATRHEQEGRSLREDAKPAPVAPGASPASPATATATAATPAAASGGDGPPFRPIANVKVLMAGLIDPAADIVWESVGTIITKAGTEERRPRTDKDWDAVRNAALHLTEVGNLLMIGDRAKDHGPWWAMSRALVDAGAVALAAAEEKNVEKLFDAGEGITSACDSCHGAYWKEDTTAANAGTTPAAPRTASRLVVDDRLRHLLEMPE